MSGVVVIGAGVVGLTVALTLAERGAKVTLVERSPELGGNASWLAGGMLAPFCEGESAPQSVVDLGKGAIDWWDARVPGVARAGTLVVAPPRDVGEIDRFAQRTRGHERVDEARIAALEPDLAGRFRNGLFFAGEGHLDPRAAMNALADALRRLGAEMRFGEDGEGLGPEAGLIVDCRGFAARAELKQLRGVRGEMIRVRTRELCFTRDGQAPPSALSPLCRAEGERRIHDRRDDDRERREGRGQRALGHRAVERGLRSASGVRGSGGSRDER